MEYLFALLIPALAVAVVIILACRIASHDFRCKHCKSTFRIKWTRVLRTVHSGDEYMLICPHCGVRDFCTEEPKDKTKN